MKKIVSFVAGIMLAFGAVAQLIGIIRLRMLPGV